MPLHHLSARHMQLLTCMPRHMPCNQHTMGLFKQEQGTARCMHVRYSAPAHLVLGRARRQRAQLARQP